ncbi:cell wall-binding repeat-containing protein [Bifidobacterium bifidum]|uniref:cell wall-binding repeat-containing protein n=1 Tax=Bifidobacterium bifidum TaxID=1681 RepID=UPI0034A5481E
MNRVSGATRIDTSFALYQNASGWGSTAIVATNANYADALSVSSYAYTTKDPVFLCDSANGLTKRPH